MAEIDNSSIEYLALIVNIARRIQGEAAGDEAGSSLSNAFQPSFLWLIRDFALRSVDKVRCNCYCCDLRAWWVPAYTCATRAPRCH